MKEFLIRKQRLKHMSENTTNKAVKIIFILSVILSFVSCAGVLRINL